MTFNKIRTRIAPSPTGFLHLGTARTALYSWAYARHFGGEFVLRIEDTDVARSTQDSVDQILASMHWLGLGYDEGPIYQMQRLERYKADAALLRQFELTGANQLFHSVVVHFENDVPIQVEDRYVNPAVAPDYMAQDFGSQTPNAYLTRVAPLQGVKYAIEASMPGPEVAELLRMEITEPCLVLRRCTRSQGQVASVSALWHPASRYQFTGSF